jgi:hypothetical protein
VAADSAPHRQTHSAVKTIDLFVVHVPSFPAQQSCQPSIPESLPFPRQLPEPGADVFITMAFQFPAIRRSRETNEPAGAALTHAVLLPGMLGRDSLPCRRQ